MDTQHWFLLQENTVLSGTALSLLLVVFDYEVFVGEHAAVDGLAALPVAVREVAALHHEVLHHAVEHRPMVVKRLP